MPVNLWMSLFCGKALVKTSLMPRAMKHHLLSFYKAKTFCTSTEFQKWCSSVVFVLSYCINPLSQFDKLYPWTLKNLTSGDQMERTNLKYKNLRPSIGQKHLRLRDAKISWKQDFWDPSKMLPRFWHWTKFSETHIFQGTVLYPSNAKCSLHQTLFISLFTPSNDWYWRDFCYVCFIACLENCRVVTFVHHIISQSFFFTLKRNKGYSIHHLNFFDLSLNKSILHKFCFTHYAGPQLKVVSTMSVGFDHVSLPDAAKR